MSPMIRSPKPTSSPVAESRAELEAFVRFCAAVLTDEADTPFVIEPFQREILADFFGGARELVVLLAKKNGKSSLLAALALWHLLSVEQAEIVVVAASRDQAAILLRQVTGFIRRAPALQARLKVVQREIRAAERGGRVRVLASDVDTVDGQLPTLALVDELHRHRSAELYGVLRDGLGPRAGQLVAISTAGDSEETPLGKLRAAAYELPGMVRTGAHRHVRAGGFAFHEYALDPEDDVDDLSVVKLANPASWIDEEELRRRHDSPSMRTWAWRRFACGIWSAGEFGAIDALEWSRCGELGLEIPEGARGPYIGVDLGFKWDCSALVPVWILGGGWREEKRQVRAGNVWGEGAGFVREWVRDETQETAFVGVPTIIPSPRDGTSTPVETIFAACAAMAGRWPAVTFVLDPLAGGEHLAQRLDAELADVTVSTYSQSNVPMCRASQRLAEMIAAGTLHHSDDAELTSHVLACGVRQVGEGWRLAKKPGSKAPIDATVALAMALAVGLAAGSEDAKPKEPPGGFKAAAFR